MLSSWQHDLGVEWQQQCGQEVLYGSYKDKIWQKMLGWVGISANNKFLAPSRLAVALLSEEGGNVMLCLCQGEATLTEPETTYTPSSPLTYECDHSDTGQLQHLSSAQLRRLELGQARGQFHPVELWIRDQLWVFVQCNKYQDYSSCTYHISRPCRHPVNIITIFIQQDLLDHHSCHRMILTTCFIWIWRTTNQTKQYFQVRFKQ